LFRKVVQPGQVVIEVGANIGAHTVPLARHVGPSGLVIAFEPQRILFQMLCANLALNSLPNVYCFNNAVGAVHGSVRVPPIDYGTRGNFGALALGGHEIGEPLTVITLDGFTLSRCDFLKVDVEGMEKQVLEGATDLIARLKPVLYVENDREGEEIPLIRLIDSMGYSMYWHRPFYFSQQNFFGNQENVFPQIVSRNMLCLPKAGPQGDYSLEPVRVTPG
jgi:FkbM family methyltransferase